MSAAACLEAFSNLVSEAAEQAQDDKWRPGSQRLLTCPSEGGVVYKAPGGAKRGEERKLFLLPPILVFAVRCRPIALAQASCMPLRLLHHSGSTMANLLHRAVRSRWWTILAFVPLGAARLMGLRSPDADRATTAARL